MDLTGTVQSDSQGMDELGSLSAECSLQTSEFVLEIKDILKQYYKFVETNYENMKNFTIKIESDLKHFGHRLFFKCAELDTKQQQYHL